MTVAGPLELPPYSQLFQNISIQLSGKQNVTSHNIQFIINSAYSESTCFDSHPSQSISLLRTFQNYHSTSNQRHNSFNTTHLPGHPTADDVFAAINNICHGNNPPPQHALSHNNNCSYCSSTVHWRSNCPVLRRDAFLPIPQDQSFPLMPNHPPPIG
ncbi:hypothetical protein VP01_2094g1, partial [Puccinia sorghi]